MEIFFDAEWVPITNSYQELDEKDQAAWDKLHQARYAKLDITSAEAFAQNAGFHAEFSKLVCISVGTMFKGEFQTKSFSGKESSFLHEFANFIEKIYSKHKDNLKLIGKGIKAYDVPFITKRLIKNNIKVPFAFRVWEQKPWETVFLDIQDIWANGNYSQGLVSLDLMCHFLNIPTSKVNIDGSQVKEYYYTLKKINEIIDYCERDVVATWQVYKKLTKN